MIDQLIEQIALKNNPTALGLDTRLEYLPDELKNNVKTPEEAAKAITEFNYALIESTRKIVPCVKIQIAYYEMYGVAGISAFNNTLKAAKDSGLVVIADAKRNDIDSTADCYAEAFLGKTDINGQGYTAFNSDFLTVNPYLGSDGIMPFVKRCQSYNKGIFVLCRTSNPSGAEFQSLCIDGTPLYLIVAQKIRQWGKDTIGAHGYNKVGAVVGATHIDEARILRKALPETFFLVPGYGAQGGGADAAAVCFDAFGKGAVVNNSRGILTAYKKPEFSGLRFDKAAAAAAKAMQDDLNAALQRR